MKKVLVLGCTGSIGKSTLDVVREMRDEFRVCALVAHKNRKLAMELSAEFGCPYALTSEDEHCIKRLIDETKPDIAVNGIAGSAGLMPSIAVLEAGVDLALANKETVVMAWQLVKEVAQRNGAAIIPVDSEHSALFNLIERVGKENILNLVITASGGPFRDLPREELEKVTVEAALKHPTWSMGQKITVDSATLANKGLEVIEACALFGFDTDSVKVAVHPQSVVHSLVRTTDGMYYAGLSEPDMKHPILAALSWPQVARVKSSSSMRQFDICGADGRDIDLTFRAPRVEDFPMLPLAYEAVRSGGAYTIAYNAANEAAANAFIAGRIRFTQVADVVRSVLEMRGWDGVAEDFNQVLEVDSKAHKMAERMIENGRKVETGRVRE